MTLIIPLTEGSFYAGAPRFISKTRKDCDVFAFNPVDGRDGMKTRVAKTLALAEEMVKVGDDPERKRGNEASGRDRQDPGPHYPPGHAPFDC